MGSKLRNSYLFYKNVTVSMQTQKIVQNIMKFRFYRKIIINIKYLSVAERFVFFYLFVKNCKNSNSIILKLVTKKVIKLFTRYFRFSSLNYISLSYTNSYF